MEKGSQHHSPLKQEDGKYQFRGQVHFLSMAKHMYYIRTIKSEDSKVLKADLPALDLGYRTPE